jgi:hypothetical protein
VESGVLYLYCTIEINGNVEDFGFDSDDFVRGYELAM